MKGLSFCDEMVLALLNTKPDVWPAEPIIAAEPCKWQTRRMIKPQPALCCCQTLAPHQHWRWKQWRWRSDWALKGQLEACAPFQPGEVFYVREGLWRCPRELSWGPPFALYSTDSRPVVPCLEWRWKRDFLPSIFMPREAARAWGVIKAVRAERVQAACPADVRAEALGIFEVSSPDVASEMLARVWNALHGPDAWEHNDWVWVYEFGRVSKPERPEAAC